MLFLTNRYPKEDFKKEGNLDFHFNLEDTDPGQIIFFCKKGKENKHTRLKWNEFFRELKNSEYRNILFYIHGYSNLPEDVFKKTESLQKMFDTKTSKEVLVVPFIWPCDNDLGGLKDYYDDKIAADRSATSLTNALNDFIKWGKEKENEEVPCLKRINILAHSMGNRVLRRALYEWKKYYLPQGIPLISRNTFLVAGDIENESLEIGKEGESISDFSRNVVVYFSNDDLALRGSKIANLPAGIASKRLGHTGPENIEKCKKNIYSIDCDDINSEYSEGKNRLLGHNYLENSSFFNHVFNCIRTGRVETEDDIRRTLILK